MLEFFQWIVDIISSLFDFVINAVTSILNFFKIIPTVLTFATSAVANLPSVVMTFATITLTVAIVLLVIGRSNN